MKTTKERKEYLSKEQKKRKIQEQKSYRKRVYIDNCISNYINSIFGYNAIIL